MHKSIFTFVLLASSLVMLSAIPLLNNNNTVAIAQEYDKYGDSSYSQYPTDDFDCEYSTHHTKEQSACAQVTHWDS